MSIAPPASVSRRILSDTFTVGAWTIAAKLASTAKVLLMARIFGAGDAMDAYLIAFLLPSFVAEVLAGSLIVALVPAFVEQRERGGREAASKLAASATGASALGLALAALLLFALSSPLFAILASGFHEEKLALTRALFAMMLGVIPLSGLTMTWRALLNAEGKFAAAAAAPLMTPLVTILLMLALAGQGIWVLAVGTTLGCFCEVLWLGFNVRRAGHSVFPRWTGAGLAERQALAQYVPLAAGTLVLGGAPLVDQAMAATLGTGSVSALNFGSKPVAVLLAIGPAALSTAVLPHFSRMNTQGRAAELSGALRKWTGLSLAATVPATLALMWFSEPIVRLLFARGAFSEASVGVVTEVQRLSFVRIPVAVLLLLVMRAISSRQENRTLLPASVLGLGLTVVLNWIFMQWFGVAGIALSAAGVYLALLLYLAPKSLAGLRSAAPQ